MAAPTQHPHLTHRHSFEELEELATTQPFPPLANADGTPERVAADARACKETQGREIELHAADAFPASDCKEVQGREIEPHAADAFPANECNEVQGLKNDTPATAERHASPCKEMQGSKNDVPTTPARSAKECKVMQGREKPPTADDLRSISEAVARPPAADLPAAISEILSDQAKLVLSQRQQTAIGLLLAGQADVRVAEKVGVHPATIWRWKQNSHFRVCLEEVRDLVFGSAIDRLRTLAPQAVDILQEQLQAGDRTAAFQLLRLIRVDRLLR